MTEGLVEHYLADVISSFKAYKKLAEKALAQVSDDELFATVDDESNSIAVIMKHMAGNMISRWTDFLTTDGEKPDRNRDMEFVITPDSTKEDLFSYWNRGWQTVIAALEPLSESDFDKRVLIRGQEHSIIEAVNRQMTHYAYHIGQIAFLAKHFRGSDWKSLSIPRNRSAEFNSYLQEKPTQTEHRLEAAEKFAVEVDKKYS